MSFQLPTTCTISHHSLLTCQMSDEKSTMNLIGNPLDLLGWEATHNRTCTLLAMTRLNGIRPAERLGCVWSWCQSRSKQVPQSAACTTSCNSETFLRTTTHLFQLESSEMIVWKHHGSRGEDIKFVLSEEIVEGLSGWK